MTSALALLVKTSARRLGDRSDQRKAPGGRSNHALLASVGLVLLLSTACGLATPTKPAPEPQVEVSPNVTSPLISSKEMAEAISVRTRFGLRTDEAWIRAVAEDPTTRIGVDEFGIPLTQAELADLMSRRWDEDLLKVRGYGLSFPDDFGGAYLNLEGSGVIIDFKNRVARHRTALANLVADPDMVEVRQVAWSLQDLEGFIDLVEAERDWFDTIGVRFVQVGHPANENLVLIDFIGPRRAAAEVIEAHFGEPTWLRARWLGPPPWAGPRADLVIKVSDARGRPVPNVQCDLTTDNELVDEFGDSMIGTGPTGICDLKNIPAVRYQVGLHMWVDNDHYDPDAIKEFEVVLAPAGKRVEVTIPDR